MPKRDRERDSERAHVDDAERPVYMISVAARLAGVHPQTLRMYERKELLTPGRTAKSTRLYSRRDVERLRHIQTLTQEEGLNLAGARVVMRMRAELEEARQEMEKARRKLAEAEARLAEDIERLSSEPGYELVLLPRRDIVRRYR